MATTTLPEFWLRGPVPGVPPLVQPVAHALLQATNGLLPYSLSTRELGEREDVEQRTADVANLMLRGLVTRK